jgi:hypothetical protein
LALARFLVSAACAMSIPPAPVAPPLAVDYWHFGLLDKIASRENLDDAKQ